MSTWLTALLSQTKPAVLITVAATQGSAPRESGAKMLVNSDMQFDTIGGGHLELSACMFARDMLANRILPVGSKRMSHRFALGPSLGQCCGGAVLLTFETIEVADQRVYLDLQRRLVAGQQSWRLLCLNESSPVTLIGNIETIVGNSFMQLGAPKDTTACCIFSDGCGKKWLLDPVFPFRSQLYLFGAGHVGAALVRALADLPCAVHWVDEREDIFPRIVSNNVSIEITDTPESVIDSAPAGASFLVMTHSHTLDQLLAEHILRRDDFDWFGVIGSRTKRVQFERRLTVRGISASSLHKMICPVGIAGIQGKQPAVIAAAVTAQLLQAWEHVASCSTLENEKKFLCG